ncbi:hypothetical protein R7D97_24580 [Vibrio sp. Vb5031]|uniref:hypothetical protein n=1 Tax=Vibrio TaxID=662 RepID=UPI00071F05FF|nr:MULTISPECIES: hypothetical protein [Vibrio]ALR91742.1 hypothetical protein AT730_04790 [Vibrio alginolyticus]EJU9539429.1 hypothetical protein [Vibrio alginolyticus]ELA8471138.1 hypothetical protein [Vibrio alginolyticus]MBS9976789.1 hypothetical protein [Vibrio alginolyticus]MBT0022955.1 hypothetical protein [Vibrio alginolyticus]
MKYLLALMLVMSSSSSFANAWLDRQHQYVQNYVMMAGTLLQTAEQHNRQCSGNWSHDKLMKRIYKKYRELKIQDTEMHDAGVATYEMKVTVNYIVRNSNVSCGELRSTVYSALESFPK